MAAGREAIEAARRALDALPYRFDAAADALRVLLDVTGRVVVRGLGKSGLVGAKLAATLSSTGTPAQFVHAADALHGDVGCLCAGDAILALSNSGERRSRAAVWSRSRSPAACPSSPSPAAVARRRSRGWRPCTSTPTSTTRVIRTISCRARPPPQRS
jgi:D-arabinose 5-phosphate isomerase GutQ